MVSPMIVGVEFGVDVEQDLPDKHGRSNKNSLPYRDAPPSKYSLSSKCGMQSTHVLSGGNRGNPTLEQMLKEYKPQVVVLQVGIYDAAADRPVEDYRANMAKAIDLILDSDAVCILSTSAPLYNRLELTKLPVPFVRIVEE